MKTNTQRQAEFKARQEAAGLVRLAEWIHKDDVQRVRSYLARLTAQRQVGARR